MELVEYQALFIPKKDWYGKDYFGIKPTNPSYIEAGDFVFLHSIPKTFTKGVVSEYIQSLGAVITKEMDSATKIISANFDVFDRRWDSIPDTIDPFISKIERVVWFSTLDDKIREYLNSKREIQPFNTDGLDTILSLLNSNSADNIKIACILIMSMDWTDQEFYLFFIFTRYHDNIRNTAPSQIPNWSNWNRVQKVGLVNYARGIYDVFSFMKKFTITEEQQTIIKKYL